MFLLLACMTVQAAFAGELQLNDVWARATPPGAPMGAVYATLVNTGMVAIQIDEVHTGVAAASEVHESVEREGMMRMRQVEPFIIPAQSTVTLKPGGVHIMLMGLQSPLQSGMQFKIKFIDSEGNEVESDVLVGGFGQMTMPR